MQSTTNNSSNSIAGDRRFINDPLTPSQRRFTRYHMFTTTPTTRTFLNSNNNCTNISSENTTTNGTAISDNYSCNSEQIRKISENISTYNYKHNLATQLFSIGDSHYNLASNQCRCFAKPTKKKSIKKLSARANNTNPSIMNRSFISAQSTSVQSASRVLSIGSNSVFSKKSTRHSPSPLSSTKRKPTIQRKYCNKKSTYKSTSRCKARYRSSSNNRRSSPSPLATKPSPSSSSSSLSSSSSSSLLSSRLFIEEIRKERSYKKLNERRREMKEEAMHLLDAPAVGNDFYASHVIDWSHFSSFSSSYNYHHHLHPITNNNYSINNNYYYQCCNNPIAISLSNTLYFLSPSSDFYDNNDYNADTNCFSYSLPSKKANSNTRLTEFSKETTPYVSQLDIANSKQQSTSSNTPTTAANVSSLKWINHSYIALGKENGIIEIWDVAKEKKIRSIKGHSQLIGCIDNNQLLPHLISTSSRDTTSSIFDIRIKSSKISSLLKHEDEVCATRWNPNNEYCFASGGNDSNVFVCDIRRMTCSTSNYHNHEYDYTLSNNSGIQPFYVNTQHTAAIKAISWHPTMINLLATGGGHDDKSVQFHNLNIKPTPLTPSNLTSSTLTHCNYNNIPNSLQCNSQITSLHFSPMFENELIASFGYSENAISIYELPTFTEISKLKGHSARILHTCLSPFGNQIVSIGADETLRIWELGNNVKASNKRSHTSTANCIR